MASRTVPPKSPRTPRPRSTPAPAVDAPGPGTDAPPRRKSTRLEARLTDAQKGLLQEAAELRGQTLTEFVVRAGEDAAVRVLEGAGVVVLAARAGAAFVEALLDPPVPNAHLRAAAARYQQHRARAAAVAGADGAPAG